MIRVGVGAIQESGQGGAGDERRTHGGIWGKDLDGGGGQAHAPRSLVSGVRGDRGEKGEKGEERGTEDSIDLGDERM